MKGRLNTKKVVFFTETDPITNRYFKDIRNIPQTEHEEQVALIKKFKETGCLDSRDKLIVSNQRFVVSVAKKFANNTNLPDLINEGNIGLIAAIEKYDVNSGFKFITYAVWYIQREIKAFLMDSPLICKTNLQKTVFHVEKIKEKFRKIEGREITIDELIKQLDTQHGIKIIDESDLYDLHIDSIDLPMCNHDDSSEFSPTENNFNNMFHVQNDANHFFNVEDNKALVREYMTILLPREKKIIELFFGFDSPMYTLDDIAKKYGYTPERIRQIKKKIIDLLKTRSKIDEIEDISQHLTCLTDGYKVLLGLHLNKKYTPYELETAIYDDISNETVFSAESIQEALCKAINEVYKSYKESKIPLIPRREVKNFAPPVKECITSTANEFSNYRKLVRLGWSEEDIAIELTKHDQKNQL